MDWFIDFTRKTAFNRSEDKALLKIYVNMKNADCKDDYICTMLGISQSKLRQIKKMAIAKEKSSVTDYVLEA